MLEYKKLTDLTDTEVKEAMKAIFPESNIISTLDVSRIIREEELNQIKVETFIRYKAKTSEGVSKTDRAEFLLTENNMECTKFVITKEQISKWQAFSFTKGCYDILQDEEYNVFLHKVLGYNAAEQKAEQMFRRFKAEAHDFTLENKIKGYTIAPYGILIHLTDGTAIPLAC